MAKFSVRHSVAQAYGLLFGRPLTVIGLTWLPAVFYAVGASFLIQRMNNAMAVAVPSASGLLGQYAFFYFVALMVATAFFGAVIAVPLTRQAFGLREEPVAAHLVVGGREFRMFFALLRYYAIVVTALVVLAVGAGVAISQGTRYAAAQGFPALWQGLPLETWFNSVAGAFATIAFLVLASRYGFFLGAIASVEDRARLGRARSLARGNFWSIALVWLIVGVPAGLLLLACETTFGGVSAAGITSVGATPFVGILTIGLIVLHTLSAGASAGAYSDMAEAVAQENEPIDAAPYTAPHMAFAQSSPEVVTIAEEPQQTHTYHAAAFGSVALAAPAAMEIATPEAEGQLQALQAGWMPPPPDAHFGSDPHDAQTRAAEAESRPIEGAPEPLAEAVAETEATAHPVEAQNASVEAAHEAQQELVAQAEGHPVVDEAAAAQLVGFDGHPVDSHPVDGHPVDGHPVPEHAQNAEFPAPPLDPAGVIASAMQAQSGFHNPG